ncbi:uncharacterized protein LOC112459172 [Temnothorax curvispinosus]|uniref:Uncharacterized protein LOC112459172 n=1 Tax=Temnothorax curvispinosus TaxID=300111 RepID=A0A6J1QDZ5_9HYME|nr:uncharacterized protein LOC112459172 [Temnothorax curvispinosus]
MTSYDKFSSWENCSRYPYVDRVSVVGAKEGDKVDFIYQFVKKRFVPVDHENFSIFHTAPEIIGPPKFQHYGKLVDLSITFNDFHMIQDGTGVSISPWRKKDILRPEDKQLRHSDFYATNDKRCIDIEFDEAVYPIRVCIYEICTPGSVRQISAQDSNGSWHELWSVSRYQYFLHDIPPQSRLFVPPLSPLSCTIKTKMLRIVFEGNWQISYTKLDAVMLIGTSKLIHSRNPNESLMDMIKKINSMYYPHCNNVYYNFTEDLNSIHLDIAYLQQNFQHYCNISNRCKHLRQLDVTGCTYTGKNMASFIKKCGSRLTHLRLSDERYDAQVIRTNSNIDLKVVLRAIPNTCTNLKELDLSYCYVEDEGFSYLEELNTLEHLNLFNTIISYERLCRILQNNQRMRELSVERINDAVLIELGTSCRNLEVLSSSFGPRHITSRGINALANCTKLERIKFNL